MGTASAICAGGTRGLETAAQIDLKPFAHTFVVGSKDHAFKAYTAPFQTELRRIWIELSINHAAFPLPFAYSRRIPSKRFPEVQELVHAQQLLHLGKTHRLRSKLVHATGVLPRVAQAAHGPGADHQ